MFHPRTGSVVRGAFDDIVAELTQQSGGLGDSGLLRAPYAAEDADRALRADRDPQASRGRAAAATNPPSGAGDVVVTSRKRAASSTVRVIGPLTLSPCHASSCGDNGTRSRCGFRPKRPHQVAGVRIDPPPSDPTPNGARPAATAAAVPPLLPPGDREGSHGLRVGPNVGDSVNGQIVISGTFVFPMTIAPAARNRRTTSASRLFARSVCRGSPSRHLAGDVDVVFDRDSDTEKRQSFAGVDAALSFIRFRRALSARTLRYALSSRSSRPIRSRYISQQLGGCRHPRCQHPGLLRRHPRTPPLPVPWDRQHNFTPCPGRELEKTSTLRLWQRSTESTA